MAFQITPEVPIAGFVFLVTASLAVYGALQYRRRGYQSELLAFISLMTAISLLELTNVFILVVTSPELKLLGYNLNNTVGINLFLYSLLWFALAYSGNHEWVNRWTVGFAVATIAVASTASVVAPEYLYEAGGLTTQGPATAFGVTVEQWLVLERDLKLPFRVFQLFGYVVSLVSAGILGRYLVRKRGDLSVLQAAVLAVGIGTPALVNSLLFVRVLPPEVNPTDIALGVTSVAFAIAIFRYRLLQVAPVGRKQLVATMSDPIVMIDDEARVVDCNPAARELVDLSEEWYLIPAAEFFESFSRQYARFAGNASVETEVTLTVDGTPRHFILNVSPIEDQDEYLAGQLIVLREVTELKEREQELERREQQLDLMRQVQSRVLRHNIRNELQVVVANNEILAERVASEHAPYAERAVDTAESLTSMATKARTIETLIERDQKPMQLDLSAVVRETVESYRQEFPAVSFEVNSPDTCFVDVAPALETALRNVVENAAQHNRGDVQTVEVTLTSDDEAAVITVADDGPGIGTHELAVIDQEAETPLEHGSGIGLWVTHWAVTQSSVEIEYDSGPDGTEVTLTVPR